jgi:hypothetical protein
VTALVDALAPFTAPSFELLGQRELLRRVDTKYVVPTRVVPELVRGLEDHYAAFAAGACAVAEYRSLYFDSPSLTCFHDHRRGRRLRHKVRIRHYPDRAISFLEIKSKRNDAVTVKRRHPIAFGREQLDSGERGFLREHLGELADQLVPQLRIDYARIGLVGITADERVTIDLELVARELGGATWSFPSVAVVEVKQATSTRASPIRRRLAAAGWRERSLSKYTTAVARMRPDVRAYRLGAGLRALGKLER